MSYVASNRGYLTAGEINEKLASVYKLMAVSVLISAGFAYLVLSTQSLRELMHGGLMWVVLIAQLALVFGMSFLMNKLGLGALRAMLYAVSALFGLSLGPIVAAYSSASVVQAFVAASVVFGAAAFYGYASKRSLMGMGSFLVVGLIGIIVCGIVNVFLQSPGVQFVLDAATVLVFTGLAAYDSQRLRDSLLNASGEEADKMVVLGALSMYLNMLNLFTALLRLTGSSDD